MTNLEQEDKKLLEDWASFQKDISDDTYRTATYGELRELLAAQDRLSYQRGVEDSIKQIMATHETDTIWKLVTIKNVRSLITQNNP